MTINAIKLFYFSGTGNAKQIALWVAELAVEKNIDCQLFDIAKTQIHPTRHCGLDPQSPNVQEDTDFHQVDGNNDLLIFISPIHGFNYPPIMLNFISRFPKGKNRVVLMCTAGGIRIGRVIIPGLAGAAFMSSFAFLWEKGYKNIGQIIFDMPANWISLHPAWSEKSMEFFFEKNQSQVKKHFEKIHTGKNDFSALNRIVADLIVAPISLAYLILGRLFLSKTLYASHKCDNCNLCVKECPVHAIKIVNQRPFWTHKCESCMRCLNICPVRAIEAAHGLVALVFCIWIMGSGILLGLFPNLFRLWLVEFLLIDVPLFWGSLFLLYRFQHLLPHNQIIEKIKSFTSLTYYKFWGRYIIRKNKIKKNENE